MDNLAASRDGPKNCATPEQGVIFVNESGKLLKKEGV
jgi:hypothetical protein